MIRLCCPFCLNKLEGKHKTVILNQRLSASKN